MFFDLAERVSAYGGVITARGLLAQQNGEIPSSDVITNTTQLKANSALSSMIEWG